MRRVQEAYNSFDGAKPADPLPMPVLHWSKPPQPQPHHQPKSLPWDLNVHKRLSGFLHWGWLTWIFWLLPVWLFLGWMPFVLIPMMIIWQLALIWGTKIYPKARMFLLAVLGPRVTTAEYNARMAICEQCTAKKGDYCEHCNCGRWYMSKLQRKNKMRNAYCPLQKHENEYKHYHDYIWTTIKQGCSSCSKRIEPPK